MPAFTIAQETYEALDPEVVAPVLERALGWIRYDALRHAREAQGILAEGLETAQADALEVGLRGAGIATFRVPQERVVRVGKPVMVRCLETRADVLRLTQGYTGATDSVPWERVRFLSAAVIDEVRVRPAAAARGGRRRGFGMGKFMLNMAAPGLGMLLGTLVKTPSGGAPTGGRKTETIVQPLADLFAGTPTGELLHVRLRARDLQYDRILGAESTHDYFEDFLRVLARIATSSSHAVVSPALKALVDARAAASADYGDARFDGEADFTRYNRWQLLVLATGPAEGGPTESGMAPPPRSG